MASPSTRPRDRGSKRADYLAGQAEAYWLLDLPGQTDVPRPTLTVLEREGDGWRERVLTGRVELSVPVRLDLDLDALG